MSTVQMPTAAPAKKLMTADEFWDFVHRPENENRDFELIRGEVVEVSRPTLPHGRICSRIAYLLEQFAEQVGWGYPISNDSGVILEQDPDTVVGPDVAFFTDAKSFSELVPKWSERPPLLAVEVLSPTDRPNKILAKVQDYLLNGVKVVWLVDYEEKTVSVSRPDRTPEVFNADSELTGGEELPGFAKKVSEFFRLPGERPAAPTST